MTTDTHPAAGCPPAHAAATQVDASQQPSQQPSQHWHSAPSTPGTRTTLPTQIAARLRRRITEGTLRPGERLPSTRTLASELGVSRGSVVSAYDQLAAEGYTLTTTAGTVVNPRLPAPARRTQAAPPSQPPARPPQALRPGAPVTGQVTTSLWRACWRAAAADPTSHPTGGSAELRTLIADHVRRNRDVDVDPACVLVTAGARDGLRTLLQALLVTRRGTTQPALAVEVPGYPSLRQVPAALGWRLAAMHAHTVPAGSDAVLVTPNHQFPWGESLDAPARLALLAQARRAGSLVIEDDYDAELHHTTPPLLALDDGTHVALLGSLSTLLSPALGLGYVIAPPYLVPALEALCVPVSGIVQDAVSRFLDAGGLRRQLAVARREEARRRSLLTRVLPQARLAAAGSHAVIPLPDGSDEEHVVRRAHQAGLGVVGVSAYWDVAGTGVSPRRSGSGVVIGLGGPSAESLEYHLRTLRSVLDGT